MILRIQMAWPWQCLESQGCGVSGDQPAALLHLYWGPVKLAASLQSPRLEALLMYSAVPSWEVSLGLPQFHGIQTRQLPLSHLSTKRRLCHDVSSQPRF